MKIKLHMVIISLLIMIIGCQSSPTDSFDISDGELIQLIRESSKVDISMDELPDQSITVIENDMEYEGIGAKIASDLGYEVDLAGRGHKSGDRNEIYFNLEGRKLDPNDWGRKGRGWDRDGWDTDDWVRDGGDKKDWKCFDLVLPVTFNMPDGSTITVTIDDEDGWAELKDWYEYNSDSEERPAIQYPVDILIRTEDGETTVTINNQGEMEAAEEECRE